MALTTVDKVKINKYLKENAKIYYLDLCDAIGKRGKVTDCEFLEFFTETAIKEFNKESKVSTKNLYKVLSAIENFLDWMHEEESEITEELLDKIRNMHSFYDEYLNRTNNTQDKDIIDEYIASVQNKCNELYPGIKISESIAKYINKINELTKTIKSLEKELEEIKKQNDSSKISADKKEEKVNKLKNDLAKLESNISTKETEINGLNQIIETLKTKITELESSLSETQQQKSSLEEYKEKYGKILDEVIRLKAIIDEHKKNERNIILTKERATEIEALIYQQLLSESCGVDKIIDFIKKNGIATNKHEIAELLKKIRTKINIESNCFSTNPIYTIVQPEIIQNQQFAINVPSNCKQYNILLVSDFHLEELNNKVKWRIDMMNDYCVENGINLILNLGDFVHGHPGNSVDYQKASMTYKLIEEAIDTIPKVDGLYHAILGGNHDSSIFKYGFDPIKLFTDEREDFINLGYNQAFITIKNAIGKIGSFGIHHPNSFDLPIDLDTDGIGTERATKYLEKIYRRQGYDRGDSYIDIIGHTHKNHFNFPGSYCYIPSLLGEKIKGACHLRVYIDKEQKINYMVFMPLSIESKLTKNNEIVYQKTLKDK